MLFDTSSIPDSAIIDAAEFGFVGDNSDPVTDNFALSLVVTTATPASNTNIATGDYLQTGTERQGDTDLAMASVVADDSTYNIYKFNGMGIGNS